MNAESHAQSIVTVCLLMSAIIAAGQVETTQPYAPAGTLLELQLTEAVSTKKSSVGTELRLKLKRVTAPKGTTAQVPENSTVVARVVRSERPAMDLCGWAPAQRCAVLELAIVRFEWEGRSVPLAAKIRDFAERPTLVYRPRERSGTTNALTMGAHIEGPPGPASVGTTGVNFLTDDRKTWYFGAIRRDVTLRRGTILLITLSRPLHLE